MIKQKCGRSWRRPVGENAKVVVEREPALATRTEVGYWIVKDNPLATGRFPDAVAITLKAMEFMPAAGRAYLRSDERRLGVTMQPVRRISTASSFTARYLAESIRVAGAWLA